MYATHETRTSKHVVSVLASHIKTRHNAQGLREAFAQGLINVVIDGRTVAAGCATGFERMVDGEGVQIDAECDERREGEVSFIVKFKEVVVLFAQKTTDLLEFAVFEITPSATLNLTNRIEDSVGELQATNTK